MEIARQLEENRRKREEAQAKYQAMQEKRKLETDRTKSSSLPRSGSGGKFNRSKVSYESGFVLSSTAQQREVVTEVTDDPMLQQIQIITGYIAQARQQNRYVKNTCTMRAAYLSHTTHIFVGSMRFTC